MIMIRGGNKQLEINKGNKLDESDMKYNPDHNPDKNGKVDQKVNKRDQHLDNKINISDKRDHINLDKRDQHLDKRQNNKYDKDDQHYNDRANRYNRNDKSDDNLKSKSKSKSNIRYDRNDRENDRDDDDDRFNRVDNYDRKDRHRNKQYDTSKSNHKSNDKSNRSNRSDERSDRSDERSGRSDISNDNSNEYRSNRSNRRSNRSSHNRDNSNDNEEKYVTVSELRQILNETMVMINNNIKNISLSVNNDDNISTCSLPSNHSNRSTNNRMRLQNQLNMKLEDLSASICAKQTLDDDNDKNKLIQDMELYYKTKRRKDKVKTIGKYKRWYVVLLQCINTVLKVMGITDDNKEIIKELANDEEIRSAFDDLYESRKTYGSEGSFLCNPAFSIFITTVSAFAWPMAAREGWRLFDTATDKLQQNKDKNKDKDKNDKNDKDDKDTNDDITINKENDKNNKDSKDKDKDKKSNKKLVFSHSCAECKAPNSTISNVALCYKCLVNANQKLMKDKEKNDKEKNDKDKQDKDKNDTNKLDSIDSDEFNIPLPTNINKDKDNQISSLSSNQIPIKPIKVGTLSPPNVTLPNITEMASNIGMIMQPLMMQMKSDQIGDDDKDKPESLRSPFDDIE